jgi:ankyrin repeat protein
VRRGFRETIAQYDTALEEFEKTETKRLAEEAKRNSKRKTQHVGAPPEFHFTPGIQSPNEGWIDLLDKHSGNVCYFFPGPGGHHPRKINPKDNLRGIRMRMAGVKLLWERPYETEAEIKARLIREKIAEQRRLDDEMLLAGRTGDVYSAKKCVRQGANPSSRSTMEGLALAHYASERGLMNVLFWLANECNLDLSVERDRFGCTGLHHAAKSGSIRVMKYLVEKCKVDPNEPDSRGRTPLLYASSGAHLECVRWLKEECDVDISAEDSAGCTAAHRAVTSPVCHTDAPRVNGILSYLAGAGLDMEEDDHWGWTPIDKAATCKNLKIVEELKRHGCITKRQPGDINPDGVEGWEASHQAAMLGEAQRLRWLHKRGIDLNLPDKRGETPLFHACAGGHFDAVQVLLRCGVDIDPRRRNNIRQNAEDIAKKHGHHECAQLIVDTRDRIAKRDARLAREAAAEKERIRKDKELEDELRRIGLTN